MSEVFQLWLPILATAIFIFIASSLIHMLFKWHNSDYRKLSNEDDVRAAIRAGSPTPGQYILPHCIEMKDMADPVMIKKFTDGPVAMITVRPSVAPTMGKPLVSWFIFTLVIAAIAATVAVDAFGIKGDSRSAAHLVGVVSFLVYAAGSFQMAIWMGKPWGSVGKDVLDSIIYAVISALTFWWLWP